MLSSNYFNISFHLVFFWALSVLSPTPGRCANLEIHIFVKDIYNQPVSAEKIKFAYCLSSEKVMLEVFKHA